MVRTTTSPTLEDERDLSKVTMQMPMFKKLAEGYLATAGRFLTRAEKSLIAFPASSSRSKSAFVS